MHLLKWRNQVFSKQLRSTLFLGSVLIFTRTRKGGLQRPSDGRQPHHRTVDSEQRRERYPHRFAQKPLHCFVEVCQKRWWGSDETRCKVHLLTQTAEEYRSCLGATTRTDLRMREKHRQDIYDTRTFVKYLVQRLRHVDVAAFSHLAGLLASHCRSAKCRSVPFPSRSSQSSTAACRSLLCLQGGAAAT